ncbi:filamentous hemagglutinin N-terminal domain-containing protein [Xylophilus rhododendri]|uniref:Filamentous hemagglutinin N-terminal domain-containing protein n=1 Tax=Xylophilus rhododendri TaxID=2697032 RepID=A0A857J942_9BURK|nr:hemagglutinin repeat-containing protein [Xylophilus rhododendri]QHI99285.1 filamentous hemagglutinin N-terminal domain-containing protein [Xylophilus rhododendri]
MNRQSFRIVFNRARGQLMAVQESAACTRKSAGGEGCRSRRRSVAGGLFLALLTWGPIHAQIVADPGAPGGQRPTVLNTASGIPQVNIQTPSAAGVSRNTYGQFDVNRPGAILNNSRVGTQTQIGGWVQGNPWLAGGSARVILNEVNSSNPSYLRGPVEVAGQRAEVIVANPAGIQVDGAGFINASRVTLTTGTPVMNGGNLESFRVRQGTVQIEGLGLDTRTADYTTILSRAMEVNAGIWAQNLKVAAGAHDASADGSTVTPAAGTGERPRFALDVAAIGGMYAGHIWLIGTEAGLGVNSRGTIAADGPLIVTADGQLINTGTLRSGADADIAARTLANAGTIAAAGSLRTSTEGTLDNRGGTMEAAQLRLASSQGDIDNRGGTLRQTGPAGLSLAAPVLSNTAGGFIGYEPVAAAAAVSPSAAAGGATASPAVAAGDAPDASTNPAAAASSGGSAPLPAGSIAAATVLRNDGGHIYAGSPVTLATPSVDNSGGTLQAQSLAVSGAEFRNVGGTLVLSQGFRADVGQFDNSGGTVRAGSLAIASAGDILNRGGVLLAQDGAADLQAGRALDNTEGRIAAQGALALRSAAATTNTDGMLAAGAALSLTAGSVSNTGGTIASTQDSASVSAATVLDNRTGRIEAARDLTLQATNLHNGGVLRADHDLRADVSAAFTDDSPGSVSAAGNLDIAAASIATAGTLAAGALADGSLATSGELRVKAAGAIAATGRNLAGGSLQVEGASLDLSGSVTAAQAIAARATQGGIDTRQAEVVAAGTLALEAEAELRNQGGTLAGGQLRIAAGDYQGAGGAVLAQGTLQAQVRGAFDNDHGSIAAGGLDVAAGSLSNRQGRIVESAPEGSPAGTAGAIRSAAGLDNHGGLIAVQSEHFTLQAGGALDNSEGVIRHASADPAAVLALSASALDGSSGQILADGALHAQVAGAWTQDGGLSSAAALQLEAGQLSNRAGQLQQTGQGDARIAVAGSLDNRQGAIASNGRLDLSAASLLNGAGRVQTAAGADLALNAAGAVDNRDGGLIAAGGQGRLSAQSLDNRGGALTAQGALAADIAGLLDNREGLVAANGDTRLAAGTLVNDSGTLASVESGLQLGARQAASNQSGRLQAAGTLAFAGAALDNRQGQLIAGSIDIDTGAAMLDNRGGTIATTAPAGDLRIASGPLQNDAGLIQSAGDLAIDTHGQALSNRDAAAHANPDAPGGITAAGRLDLQAGPLDNSAGLVAAAGPLHIALAAGADGTALRNAAGRILGQSGITLQTASGILDNRVGQIQTAADLSLDARNGSVDNSAGLLRAGGRLDIAAATVANRTSKEQDQGIEARDLAIRTTVLDNTQGAIRSENAIDIAASRLLDNSAGLIVAGGTLTIADPQAAAAPASATLLLRNGGGRLLAGTDLAIAAATIEASGQAQAGRDMRISTTQDTVHDGQWSAARDLAWTTPADLLNQGLLHAGRTLDVQARNLGNAAGAELSAEVTTALHAAGTLANQGLIDGSATRIDVGTLDNTGAARIYGDDISIAAQQLRNLGSFGGAAPTIAARERLDIGAATVLNQDGALLLSLGDTAIGGSLDASRRAAGSAADITNASATIEALGSIALSSASVQNLDLHLQTARQTVSTGHEQTLVPDGQTERFPASEFVEIDGYIHHKLHPELYGTVKTLEDAIRPAACGDCTENFIFEPADSRRFEELGVTPPPSGMGPLDQNGEINSPWTQLQAAIVRHNAVVAENDALSVGYSGWTVYDTDSTTSRDVLIASAPARISAGGDIRIAGALTNRDSQVIAGGAITTDRPPQNLQTTGQQIEHSAGTATHWHRVTHTFQDANAHTDGTQPYQPADTVTTYPLATGLAYQQYATASGAGHSAGSAPQPVAPVPADVASGRVAAVAMLASPTTASVAASADRGADSVDTKLIDDAFHTTQPAPPPTPAAPAPAPAPSAADAAFVRVATPPRTLPSASLFSIDPSSSVPTLVQTDPRFTDRNQWLSSDYMLAALGQDPALAQKRLGHGFYEQQLLRKQVAQLTGRRFLGALIANAGNATQVRAGQDLNIGMVAVGASESVAWNTQNHRSESETAEIGSSIATVSGITSLQAAQDISIRQGQLEGGTGLLAVQAGRDIAIAGSQVVADSATQLTAGRDIVISAQTQTSSETHDRAQTRSGLMGSGGIGVTVGQRAQNESTTSTATTAAASTVGSINGNIAITAGNQYRQIGSDVVAPTGDIAIQARDVQIVEARETTQTHSEQHLRQSGLTLAVTSPVIAALQSAAATVEAVGQTQSGRMQALGAASAAMQAGTAAQGLAAMGNAANPADAAKAGNVGISLSLGSSQSDSSTDQTSDSARGSTVQGRNVAISATGAGHGSNILIRGSDVSASSNVSLDADNRIDILAAQDTASQHSKNSSSSASVGIALQAGSSGSGIGFNAAASMARGHADGEDVIQSNSHISAGNRVDIHSGGDTNIIGGVISANQVAADIGGKLTIQSLQDTSRYESRQQSAGASVMVGAGGGGSASFSNSNSKSNADYASVAEQSGIQAGAGGFQVNVKGSTDLVGGIIASTQAAVDSGVNRFDTQSLTTSDIQNHADYNASGFSLSGSYSPGGTGKASDGSKQGATPNSAGGINGAAAGIGSASGHASSTTTSGISGIAGNTEARTGASSNGLVNNFDPDKVAKEVAAQVHITSTFGQQAAKAVGDYADAKYKELKDTDPAEAAKWAEGGAYRVAAHALAAGLTGGIQGAIGSAASQLAIDAVAQQIAQTDLPTGVKNALVAAAGTAIGAAAGGAAGAAGGFNATTNNYLTTADLAKHDPVKERQARSLENNAAAEDACLTGNATTCGGALAKVAADITDLKDYQTQLELQAQQTSDPAAAAQLNAQISEVNSQIESARNVARVGLMALDGGNFDLSTLTPDERMAIGFALDPVEGVGRRTALDRSNFEMVNILKITLDPKIAGQMEARGWDLIDIHAEIGRGAVGTTMDNRSAAKTADGQGRNDSASVYGSKNGYIVVNDRTGEIVQLSNRNDPKWIPDSRIIWK